MNANRREFMSDVGHGMLAAGLGASLASDLGFSTAFAEEGSESIPLGKYTRLVELMRDTAAEKLQPLLAAKIQKGETSLKQLVAAGALANAVTFGGCDYVGFHTAMAMLPALEMSRRLPSARKPLPVLKVLYRNSQLIQNVGGASKTTLHALKPVDQAAKEGDLGQQIRVVCRKADVNLGESLLATVGDSPLKSLNALQPTMQDSLSIHRFVFAHRTYGLVGLLGKEHSYSMLRQCVRFACNEEQKRLDRKDAREDPIRALVPKLLDQFKLAGKKLGKRDPGDAFVEELSQTIYHGPREQAAEAVAAALAEGIDPEVVGEAISLCSNLYVLRQPTKGRDRWRSHGNSPGVHSSDATNAWRNMGRVADPQHAVTGLIVAGYYAGLQAFVNDGGPFETPAYPTDDHRALVKVSDAKGLLAEAEDAIRHNDQGRAAAAIQIYGERGYKAEPVFALMLKYAVSEDGRLHAEKYYQTVTEEYRTIRPAFRWRQVVGLARVTASAYGYDRKDKHGFRAAGYEDACKLLGVES
jgi:hypothetical protein